jgi:signal peptidase I
LVEFANPQPVKQSGKVPQTMSRRVVITVASLIGVTVLLAIWVVASGLQFYTVMTPSMGQTAPVGSLVASQHAAEYRVGEIVTYERNARSYTHRIITLNPDGTFVTKGDLNSTADALPVAKAEIVGRAIWIVPGLGWLWQGLPWLVVGGILVYLLSLIRNLDRSWRWVVRISGWTLVLTLVAVWLRPWVSLSMLGFTPAASGVDMHVVNTGLFPLDVLGNRLVSGQDAVVNVTAQDAQGRYTLTPGLAFRWWEQLGIYLLCLVPMGASFLIRDKPETAPSRALDETSEAPTGQADRAPSEEADAATAEEADEAGPSDEETAERGRRRRVVLIVALVVAVVISVAVVTFATTSAALTAKVTNSTDTAGTRAFFTCRDAITKTASGYLGWALDGSSMTEADLTGNSRTGYHSQALSTYTTSVGCLRDTPKAAITFAGNRCVYQLPNTLAAATPPTNFSLEAWFRTSTTSNGQIIAFGNSRNTVTDSNHDRKIYLDRDGRIVFGLYPGAVKIVYSPAGTNYADGTWHHVVATLSTSGDASLSGQRLYVDGQLAMANTAVTTAQAYDGYWKVGCGNLAGWQNAATAEAGNTSNYDYSGPSYFTGQIQFAAVYSTALTAAQVKEHYVAGVN